MWLALKTLSMRDSFYASIYYLNLHILLLEFENGMVITCKSNGEQVPLLEGAHNKSNCSTFHMSVIKEKKFAILYSLHF
jgi:hypothetical protein